MRKDTMSTVSKITFGDKHIPSSPNESTLRKRPLLDSIASMTDEEIISSSVKNAKKQAENSQTARALKNGPLLFAVTSSVVLGALTKGKLSTKAASGIKTLGSLALVAASSKLVENIADTKEETQNKKNSFLEFGIQVGATLGLAALALKGGDLAKNKLAQKFAPTSDVLKKSFKQTAKKIDKSKIGKYTDKISKGAALFAERHPVAAGVLTSSAVFAPCVGFLANSSSLANTLQEETSSNTLENINKLTLCREFAKAGSLDFES